MAMTTSGSDRRSMSDINVTPLVDVMLVLLVVFMVTAPMMTQGIAVALPKARGTAIPSHQEKVILTITRDQSIFIDRMRVPLADLAEKLRAIYAQRTDRDLYLRADEEVPYGVVVRTMAEVRRAGIENLGMITAPPKER